MNDRELRNEIKECAEYIDWKRRFDAETTGRDLSPGQAETLRDEMKRRLQEVEQMAKDLDDAILELYMQIFRKQIGKVFLGLDDRLKRAREASVAARGELGIAIRECIPPPRTRAMTPQRSAVRLAHGMVEPRRVRQIAKEIILEAGLEQVDDRTLSNWIKEERENERRSELLDQEMRYRDVARMELARTGNETPTNEEICQWLDDLVPHRESKDVWAQEMEFGTHPES